MIARINTHPAMLWIGDHLLPAIFIGSFGWAIGYAVLT